MAATPGTQVLQTILKHSPCGYPLRIVIRLYGCSLTPGRRFSDIFFTYTYQELTYYTHDAYETRVSHCPLCHVLLPKNTTKEAA